MGSLKLHTLVLLAGVLRAFPAMAQDDEPDGVGDESPALEDGEAVEGDEEALDDPEVDLQGSLNTVETDVADLTERVFKSKATLALLKELVIDSASMSARVAIWHVNKLGGAYFLESVQYYLDGRNVFSKADLDSDGALHEIREQKVHEQGVPPGAHSLQVNLVLRGKGLGVFKYLEAYSIKVQSSYQFDVPEGTQNTIRVLADERGNPFLDFTERPTVKYDERIEKLTDE
jgi:hypothetical protein